MNYSRQITNQFFMKRIITMAAMAAALFTTTFAGAQDKKLPAKSKENMAVKQETKTQAARSEVKTQEKIGKVKKEKVSGTKKTTKTKTLEKTTTDKKTK